MTRSSHLSKDEHKQRKLVAARIVAQHGNLSRFAEAVGISKPAALVWLRRHEPGLLAELCNGRAKNAITPHQALVRLLWLKAVQDNRGHLTRVCRALGVSTQRMLMFRKYWAPDGIDAAIADLMPHDDNGKSGIYVTDNGLFPIGAQESAHG